MDRFYDIVVGNPQNAFNDTLRRQKTYEINEIADAIFTPYYQIFEEDSGTYFLDPWPTDSNIVINDLGHFRRRLEDFGNGNRPSYMIPIFSGEIIDTVNHIYCGAYNFLGQFLDGPPDTTNFNRGNHFHKVETIFQTQYDSIYYNQQTYFPNITNNVIPAFAWFKSSCLWEKTGFSDKSLVPCEDFNSMSIPRTTSIEEVSKTPTITVFPNPNSGNFTIRSNESLISLKLYNLTGTEIYTASNVNTNELQLNLQLISGIYVLVSYLNNGSIVSTKISVL